ncbi:MAG TPA: MBL fold metallo-hydrolase [Vicinamibacterales bacterium]|nr:MBL fold metallo-hydrolase [Vicinamibacterales bacterium]
MVDRREFLVGAAAGLIGLALPPSGSAQQAATTRLTDRLSLITAGGTNVLAYAGAEGLVLVDSGAPAQTDTLMAAVRQVSTSRPQSITLFNTHWHLENTGGNEAIRAAGATIVAHENTRLWMATPVWSPAEDRYRQPRPAAARPDKTFYDTGSMTTANERVEYGYLIAAHTSGDIYVRFRDANVLAVGDVASPARDPELDWFTGAWIGGRVDAMARLLTMCDDRTRIVPGYGPVMTKAQLQAEHDVMKTVYDRVFDLVRKGDESTDMLKAGVLNGLPRTWKDPQRFLYDVQKGLWAHHNKLSPDVV